MKYKLMAALKLLMLQILLLTFSTRAEAQNQPFKVLVVASTDPDHGAMIIPSQALLEKIGSENGFAVDFTRDASLITDENLLNYKVVVQLHLAYFEMTQKEQSALQHFISRGKGWIGIHAAGLTGKQFINKETPYWDWYQKMIGGVTYSDHPALQTGTIKVEDREHPVMKNLPASFTFYDEWYEFDKSPRSNVHVLATADETSYKPKKPMGDHPMIWTNPSYDRVIYIGIGHDSNAISDPNFTILIRDAILWTASSVTNKEQTDLDNSLGSELTILASQVAYNMNDPKSAMVRSKELLPADTQFELVDALTFKKVFSGTLTKGIKVQEWSPELYYSKAEFTSFHDPGYYKLVVRKGGKEYSSYDFTIDNQAIGKVAIPAKSLFFQLAFLLHKHGVQEIVCSSQITPTKFLKI